MSASRIYWKEEHFHKVAARAVELVERGMDKTEALIAAQSQMLPPDLHRPVNVSSKLGPKFDTYYNKFLQMTRTEFKKFGATYGIDLLCDKEDRAKAPENLEPVAPPAQPQQEVAPEPKPEDPVEVPAPVVTPMAAEPVPALLGQAEQALCSAAHAYVLAILQPTIANAVEQLRREYMVPQLQRMLAEEVDSALQEAIAGSATKLRSHLDTQLSALVPPVALEPETRIQGTLGLPAKPQEPAKPLRLHDHWDETNDNIVVLGVWAKSASSVALALRDQPWFKGVKLEFVTELNELFQKVNQRTHLIHMEKSSAHLPKGFRDRVKRIYPNVKGMTRIRTVVEAIVRGNLVVESY